jgi:hypothetical protein
MNIWFTFCSFHCIIAALQDRYFEEMRLSDAIIVTAALVLLLVAPSTGAKCKENNKRECKKVKECRWSRNTRSCSQLYCYAVRAPNRCKFLPLCEFSGGKCRKKKTPGTPPSPFVTAAPTEMTSTVPTETVSNTPTVTKTSSPTETASNAPTETVSNAPTVTKTSSPTETASNAPTDMPTHSTSRNVARSSRGGVASQSGTYVHPNGYTAHAIKAIDGNTSGVFWNRSVSATTVSTNTWWKVKLAKKYVIDKVVIYNRTDCCAQHNINFVMYIYKEGVVVYDSSISAPTESSTLKAKYEFSISNIIGDEVKVVLPREGYVTLAEVVVLGK